MSDIVNNISSILYSFPNNIYCLDLDEIRMQLKYKQQLCNTNIAYKYANCE